MIMFVLFTLRLLIGTSVNWATTIPCCNLTGKNAPALFPKFIGNVIRLSVTFATVSVHPENDLEVMTGNVENEKLRQQNARVAMCQLKYLFKQFWSVIH